MGRLLRILFSVNISRSLFLLLSQYYIACIYIKGSSKYMSIVESLNRVRRANGRALADIDNSFIFIDGSSTYCLRMSSPPLHRSQKKNKKIVQRVINLDRYFLGSGKI